MCSSFTARNQFAVGRENGGDANDVARGNASVPQSELETREPFTMFTDAFGEEDFLSNDAMVPVCRASVSSVRAKKFSAVEK